MKNSTVKKRILIFSEYYLPGYKSGGGMRTIVNIVTNLGDKYDFFIVTKNHDGKSDKTPYKEIKIDKWNEVENSQVFYLDKNNTNFSKILEIFKEVDPDILYSNSYFSIFDIHLLVLKRLGRLNQIPYIISPCGELSKNSFKMGTFKKNIFVKVAEFLGLHKNIIWKVSTEVEKKEFEQIMGSEEKLVIARDLIAKTYTDFPESNDKPAKSNSSAKFVFLSRFNRKKNFKFLLENLLSVKGNVEVDVFGPIDDVGYWNECLEVIKKLPENIIVETKKPVPHEQVIETLRNYHFFVLPTRHENFGHIFLEAFSAGCPIVISDRTPWGNLEEQNIGWDIPLEDNKKWKNVLQKCVEMDQKEYSIWSNNTREFLENWVKTNNLEIETTNLFENALNHTLD